MFTIHIDNVKHICCGAREYERVRNRLYGSRNDDDTRALFVPTDVWYRIESYHAAADLPRDCTDLYWRTPPRNFEIWKRDQLVSVTFGEVYELLWFVRRTDCTLRRLYEQAHGEIFSDRWVPIDILRFSPTHILGLTGWDGLSGMDCIVWTR